MSIKKTLLSICIVAAGGILAPKAVRAQYCTPSVTAGNLYIAGFNFGYFPGSITSPANYSSGYNGYSQTVGSSSGTILRYAGASYLYYIHNSAATTQNYTLRTYADWNNDGDFNDDYEQASDITSTVTANATLSATTYLRVPVTAVNGNVRVRFIVAESGSAPSCGPITGEVEDYTFTVASNIAPTLKTTTQVFLNSLLTSQTNTEGVSVNELIYANYPSDTLIKEPNDVPGMSYPRGLAIIGQNAVNGSWQYKIGNGSWTSFGSPSTTAALLLLGNGTIPLYNTNTRIRFVPTGAGSASFSFRAWDGFTGTNGSAGNASINGGTTAYSVNASTASINVYSTVAGLKPAYFMGQDNDSALFTADLKQADGSALQPSTLIPATMARGGGYDVALDAVANKLYWLSKDWNTIYSSNTNGSGLTTVVSGMSSPGLAIGGNRVFYTDYNPPSYVMSLYKVNKDGTNKVNIVNGTGQFALMNGYDVGDIEYDNGFIYFVCQTSDNLYRIIKADTTGLNPFTIYSGPEMIAGLGLANGRIFWTEGGNPTYYLKTRVLPAGTITTLLAVGDGKLGDVNADNFNAYVAYNPAKSNITVLKKIPVTGGAEATTLTMPLVIRSFALSSNVVALPVDLIDYTANLQGKQSVRLAWKTANEHNNDHFELYRSGDGLHFEFLASVAAAGGGNVGSAYQFIDIKPSVGHNYYRLQQYDLNGARHDYGIRSAFIDGSLAGMKIYPNPITDGSFTIELGVAPDAPLACCLTDLTGKTLYSGILASSRQLITVSQLAPGPYLLQIEGHGSMMVVRK